MCHLPIQNQLRIDAKNPKDKGRTRAGPFTEGCREVTAESQAHEAGMLLHISDPHTSKKSLLAQETASFSAEVQQILFPFCPSKRVKLKKSALIKTKSLILMIQVNHSNCLKLHPEEAETVL